jgi:PIN domain nuclease of toxin-antitoxin system
MRLLLDTHALLWLAHEPDALSATARDAIIDPDNEVYVSAVSAIEIATKFRKGALEYRTSLATDFSRLVMACGFDLLSITCDHAQRAGNLPGLHKDPWDRLLVAQAQIENLTLVSVDKKIAALGAVTYW